MADKGFFKDFFKPSREYEVKYGLRKVLIVWTHQDTMMGIDSRSGEVIWRNKWRLMFPDLELHDLYEISSYGPSGLENTIYAVFLQAG